MKKLLAIAILATAFVACNDAENKTEEKTTTDSTNTTVVTPAPDTTKPAMDTTAKMATPDSTKK